MGGSGSRIQSYSDVVSLPATKSATGALTLQSAELHPFENGSWDKAVVHMTWDGDSLLGDTILVKPYVCWTYTGDSNGDTWVQVGEYREFRNGAAEVAGDTYHVIPFCPRLRFDVVFDATATLSTNHGAQIDVSFYEADPEARRHFFYDCIDMGDSLADPNVENAGDSVTGDTLDLESSCWLQIYTYGLNDSKFGDTLYLEIWHSMDMENWRKYDTTTTAKFGGSAMGEGDSAPFVRRENFAEGDTTGLYRYIRAKVLTDDMTGGITSGHGGMVHIIGVEK